MENIAHILRNFQTAKGLFATHLEIANNSVGSFSVKQGE